MAYRRAPAARVNRLPLRRGDEGKRQAPLVTSEGGSELQQRRAGALRRARTGRLRSTLGAGRWWVLRRSGVDQTHQLHLAARARLQKERPQL